MSGGCYGISLVYSLRDIFLMIWYMLETYILVYG